MPKVRYSESCLTYALCRILHLSESYFLPPPLGLASVLPQGLPSRGTPSYLFFVRVIVSHRLVAQKTIKLDLKKGQPSLYYNISRLAFVPTVVSSIMDLKLIAAGFLFSHSPSVFIIITHEAKYEIYYS